MRFRRVSLSALLVGSLLLGGPADARVRYVDSDAPGPTHDGSSWKTAYRSIKQGTTWSLPGDEIWVAQGIYTENIAPSTNQELYGGFAGTETEREQRDWNANPTVLDGSMLADQPVVACRQSGIVVDGFSIRNGQSGIFVAVEVTASNNAVSGNLIGVEAFRANRVTLNGNVISDNDFAGVWIDSIGPATLTNNTLSLNGNMGVFVVSGAALLTGNTVSENNNGVNVATSGNLVLEANTIADNRLSGATLEGTATLANNTIYRNSQHGISIPSGKADIIGNTVCANGYDGLNISAGAVASVVNTLVAHNRGYGVRRETQQDQDGEEGDGTVYLSHSIVYGNARGNFTGVPDPTGTDGNLSVDPDLAQPYRNTHIQPSSPCVDAGDTAAVIGTKDMDGQPRVIGQRVDIGADESDGTLWIVPSRTLYVSPDGSDAGDGLSWSSAKRTVSGALSIVQGSDEVWVAGGTYTESIILPMGVSLYGGFSGTETERSQRDPAANPTVLSGMEYRKGIVVTCPFPDVVVSGFTIRDGDAGVLLSAGPALVTDNIITEHTSCGVYLSNASRVTLTGNIISGNRNEGVGIQGSTATLTNNTIARNGDHGIRIVHDNPDSVAPSLSVVNTILAFNGGYGVCAELEDEGGIAVFSHNAVSYTHLDVYKRQR